MIDSSPFGRYVLWLDGGFLALAGAAGLASDAAGHFLGIGPLSESLGSAYTIGAFEAHGLAVIIGFAMLGTGPQVLRFWHSLGLIVHLLLGSANLLFWTSFVQLEVVAMGIATTVFHAVFVVAQGTALLRGGSGSEGASATRARSA